MSLNSPYIGHVNKETIDNLVVFEEQNERNDIPLSEIKTTGRNLLMDLAMKEISSKFLVNRSNPLNVEDFVGYIMNETNDKIVVFGDYVQRYDIPKSKIYNVGSNVILNMNDAEFLTYEVNNYTSLPK